MIDYTHPARHAHVACRTWDDAGHECAGAHDCDALTIVSTSSPNSGHRYVITGDVTPGVRSYVVTAPAGRGAHRRTVSLVKTYAPVTLAA